MRAGTVKLAAKAATAQDTKLPPMVHAENSELAILGSYERLSNG
jgi:hypothetical protein